MLNIATNSISKSILSLLLLWMATFALQAQFIYTTNGNAITITGYTGAGGSVTIPTSINGWSVTNIRTNAFQSKTNLTGITIPGSVTNIGGAAFSYCTNLTNVTIAAGVAGLGESAFSYCSKLTSVMIPGSVASIGPNAFGNCGGLTSVIICAGVVSIEDGAFSSCNQLTNVTIPRSVTNVGTSAFNCLNLKNVFFKGNSPGGNNPLILAYDATVYYLPGTAGWGSTFGGYPTALWNPVIKTTDAAFGVRTNRFGFNITGTINIPIVLEASTNLTSASWTALQTCTVTNGLIYFSDPAWTNVTSRSYRIRSP